jgi:isopentenyl diphosphate isomerase/L-lactate dehydrogenase-like FMN-dependent dehydrogenase
MTIDERLEALTQSVELLAAMHRDHEKQNAEALRQNEEIHGEMMLAIVRLGRIVEAHNGQLDDHENRIDKLEGGQ